MGSAGTVREHPEQKQKKDAPQASQIERTPRANRRSSADKSEEEIWQTRQGGGAGRFRGTGRAGGTEQRPQCGGFGVNRRRLAGRPQAPGRAP
jgi:hypothetical protein